MDILVPDERREALALAADALSAAEADWRACLNRLEAHLKSTEVEFDKARHVALCLKARRAHLHVLEAAHYKLEVFTELQAIESLEEEKKR